MTEALREALVRTFGFGYGDSAYREVLLSLEQAKNREPLHADELRAVLEGLDEDERMTNEPKLLNAFKAGATFALSASAPTDVAQEEAFKEWFAEVTDPLYGEKMDCLLVARLGMDQAGADQTTVPCACEAEGDTLNVRRHGTGRVRGICAACGFQAVE